MDKWEAWFLEVEGYSKKEQESFEERFGISLLELQALIALFYLGMGGKPNLPLAQRSGYYGIQSQMVSNMEKLFGDCTSMYDKYINSIYRKSYSLAIDLIKGVSKQGLFSPDVFKNLSESRWAADGLTALERLARQKVELKGRLLKELDDSIIAGRSPAATSNALVDIYSSAYKRAEALLQTEMTYATNQSMKQALIDNGYDKYLYSAVLDSRTSQICRSLDGKVFRIEDSSVGVNMPPMHPRCRSFITPYNGKPTP